MAGGFHNLRTVIFNWEQLGLDTMEAIHEGLAAEAEQIMASAKAKVPVETGELINSAFVDPVRTDGARTWVALGFTAPHSVPVHEDLTATHEQGQAKFLQAAVDEAVSGMTVRFAERIKRRQRRHAR